MPVLPLASSENQSKLTFKLQFLHMQNEETMGSYTLGCYKNSMGSYVQKLGRVSITKKELNKNSYCDINAPQTDTHFCVFTNLCNAENQSQ